MTVIKPVLIHSGSLQLHFYIDSVEQQLLKDINELQHGNIEVNLKNIDQEPYFFALILKLLLSFKYQLHQTEYLLEDKKVK